MAQLGELERIVMERVWAWNREVTVRDVLEDLQRHRVVAYTTVMTIMHRLERKGFLVRVSSARTHTFRGATTREAHVAELMTDAWSTAGDRQSALMHFVDKMSAAEARQLRALLAKPKRKGRP